MTEPATSPWGGLLTEARHPNTMSLDQSSAEDIVRQVLEEDRRGLDAALAQRQAIARVANDLAEVFESGGRTVLAGAGTSGRLGVLEAAECPPTFGTDPQRIAAVIAGGREAVFAAMEGAEDIDEDGRSAVADLGPGDLLIAISASSVTAYARGALAASAARGCRTALITCSDGQGLEGIADTVVALATGPEVLTGSTRLKAGSATKAVLNAITTAAMVRCGKVFENLMVDLRPGSAKLADRAVRIVAAATERSAESARELLQEAAGEVKTAIVAGRLEIGTELARGKLATAGGHVRRALSAATGDEGN